MALPNRGRGVADGVKVWIIGEPAAWAQRAEALRAHGLVVQLAQVAPAEWDVCICDVTAPRPRPLGHIAKGQPVLWWVPDAAGAADHAADAVIWSTASNDELVYRVLSVGKADELVRVALGHSEQRFRLLATALTDAIWDLDVPSGNIVWSAGLHATFGATEGDLTWWRDQIHEGDRERVLTSFQQAVDRGLSWAAEYRFRHVDGHYRWVYDRGLALRGPDGRSLRMVGAMTDITDRRLAQEGLRQSDRLATLGQLASGLAHEVSNPLAQLIAGLSLALETEGGLPPAVTSALTSAMDGATRIGQTVRTLRGFVASDRPGDTLDLPSVVRSAVGLAQNEIRHRAKLVLDLPDVGPVRPNEAELGHGLLALVLAAVHAIPEGAANRHEIGVSLSEHKSLVRILVTTTGKLAADELQLVETVVRRFGGTVHIDVDVGQVALDVPKSGPVEPKPLGPTGTQTVSLRVLVIDDETPLLELVRAVLRAHHVTTCASALRALERIREGETFDVVVCDLMMPEMTGMAFYEELAALQPDLARRVIFLTGGAFTERAQNFLTASKNLRLDKPFRVDDLRAMVGKASEL